MKQPLSWTVAGALLLAALATSPRAADGARQASNFRNIQVLEGMSDGEIGRTMRSWSSQLGVGCVDCHVQGDFAADDLERKGVARQMVGIVGALNETPFFRDSKRRADCYLCHKGSLKVESAP